MDWSNITDVQRQTMRELAELLPHAHETDLLVRINGQDQRYQADWVKDVLRWIFREEQAGPAPRPGG